LGKKSTPLARAAGNHTVAREGVVVTCGVRACVSVAGLRVHAPLPGRAGGGAHTAAVPVFAPRAASWSTRLADVSRAQRPVTGARRQHARPVGARQRADARRRPPAERLKPTDCRQWLTGKSGAPEQISKSSPLPFTYIHTYIQIYIAPKS